MRGEGCGWVYCINGQRKNGLTVNHKFHHNIDRLARGAYAQQLNNVFVRKLFHFVCFAQELKLEKRKRKEKTKLKVHE